MRPNRQRGGAGRRTGRGGPSRALLGVVIALTLSQAPGQAQEPAHAQDSSSGPTWEELRARPFPQWFRGAKLGIFIHWGVYSVPSYAGPEDYGEWFLRGLEVGDTLRTRVMREWYGPGAGYRDLAPLFRAELFDPDEWADLFRRAGARYVVMVAKHHDGFALWPSAQAPGWNSMDVGPHRDLVGDLTDAVRRAGLRMGLYYSLAEWDNPLHRWYVDPPDSIGPYVQRHMIPQFRDLVTRYRPALIFADGEWLNTAAQWHARELIGWYYRTAGPDAVVNDRWGAGADIGFRTPEYSAGIEPSERPWTEVRGLGRSFGLNRNERLDAYMTPGALVRRFVRAVGAGGGMILNVGPKADGQIPLLQQERLLQLGSWLAVNGEAIYGSTPWVRTGEWRNVSVERVDPTIDFDWVRNAPDERIREDHFTAEWTGWLEVETGGDYTFEAEADDGVRVWVDDTLLVDHWGQGTEDRTVDRPRGAAHLAAGARHSVRVQFHEETHQASVRLYWSGPGIDRGVVPADRFYLGPEAGAAHGLHAVYRSQEQTVVYTRHGDNLFAVFFEWPDGELSLPVPEPAPGTEIRFLGLDRALPWRWTDGTLRVDFSGIAVRDIPGQWAWTLRIEGNADTRQEARR